MQATDAVNRPVPTREIPQRPWSMRMTWHDLLFMSWPVCVSEVAALIPASLGVDTFDGTAWISIVPFQMTGVAPRWVPNLPWLSRFPELNVRTYVIADGKPGVWFFTLDATNPVAVRVARGLFRLNYLDARINVERCGNWIQYSSKRTHRNQPAARLSVDYRPIGDSYLAVAGTLEHWLTARYCLYTAGRKGQLYRGDIDHRPWSLKNAQAVIHRNTMTDAYPFKSENAPVSLQFAERMDVVAWSLESIS